MLQNNQNNPPRSAYEINERTNDYKFGRLNAIPYSVDTLQFYCNLTMKAFHLIFFNFNFSVNFRIIRTAARVRTHYQLANLMLTFEFGQTDLKLASAQSIFDFIRGAKIESEIHT